MMMRRGIRFRIGALAGAIAVLLPACASAADGDVDSAPVHDTEQAAMIAHVAAMPGNPYDGHTLAETLEQVGILTGTDRLPAMAIVDKGYRGVEIEGVRILMSGQKRGITRTLKAMIKRRSAIEPAIGHMKMDGRLARNPLKGALGDALHAVMCGAGHNLRLILAALRLYCVRVGLPMQAVIAALLAATVENRPPCC